MILWWSTLVWHAAPSLTITVRDFNGNTSIQNIGAVPRLYVIGPPQNQLLGLQQVPVSTQLLPGANYHGLYIREKEPSLSPDGNAWFRWEEDQPIGQASPPTTYTVGVF